MSYNNILKHVNQTARHLKKRVMMDVCQLIPAQTTGTYTPEGILIKVAQPARLYNGSANIPCRADLSRSFRPDKLKVQPVVVDEYNLELPVDVTIETSDTVVIAGHEFKIRKLKDISVLDASREALIEELRP